MNHFVMLPMASQLGGKTSYVDIKVSFDYNEERESLNFTSIVGKSGKDVYDFSHLTHTHGEVISELVWGNKGEWNNEEIWYRSTGLGKRLKLV